MHWGFARLNPGLDLTRHDRARVPFAEIEPVIVAVLEVGRRRGRAEFAAELAVRLGIAAELGIAPAVPAMSVAIVTRDAVPEFVVPERAEKTRAEKTRSPLRRP